MQPTAHMISSHVHPLATAWALSAWPPLLWQATEPKPVRFHHLGTHITPTRSLPGCFSGQTLWMAHGAEGEAGMAWDWIEIAHGVVAMADPLSVVSNVRFIGDEGEVLTALQAAPYLNGLVHQLPWQREVARALRRQLN